MFHVGQWGHCGLLWLRCPMFVCLGAPKPLDAILWENDELRGNQGNLDSMENGMERNLHR